MDAKKAQLTGTAEIIKADGRVIPLVLTAETDLPLEELKEKTGLPITEEAGKPAGG